MTKNKSEVSDTQNPKYLVYPLDQNGSESPKTIVSPWGFLLGDFETPSGPTQTNRNDIRVVLRDRLS